ncbi:hypothetical protein GC209_05250 [bacterium]|nr:hypothetical protein [bacterium]
MAYALPSEGVLDYFPCQYGASNLMFRGPRRSLERPYVVFLGGNETYGKFIPDPFPDLVEEEIGLGAVNLGLSNAGPDLYLNEASLLDVAAKARAVVVQIMGAANVSNRYYAVHPRRNDRFLGATPLLKALFRDVDFTEFTFTRHLLHTLQAQSPDRFEVLADELRSTWLARMKSLLNRLPQRTLLLWTGDQPPPQIGRRATLDHDPLLIDADMLGAIRPLARLYVEAVMRPESRAEGLGGMAFAPSEAHAAAAVPGPEAHRDIARLLVQGLENLMK